MKNINLQQHEIQLLKALKDGKETDISALDIDLDQVAVARASYSLEKNNLALIKEEDKLVPKITNEGRKVMDKGLPEKQLIREVRTRKKLSSIKLKDKNVAIGWAKRKGFIDIERKGMDSLIKATKNGVESLKKKEFEEKYLDKIKNNEEVEGGILKELKKRRFVSLNFKTIRKVKLTKKGLGLAKKVKLVKEVSQLTPSLITTGKWKSVKLRKYNVLAQSKKIFPGRKQPYRAFLDDVKKKLLVLGFEERIGPLIETEFWNFDALYQPQGHSARTWTDTYHLKYPKKGSLPAKKIVENVKKTHEDGWTSGSKGWRYRWNPEIARQLMPRAHTTSVSARTLAENPEIPGKYFTMSRVYRPDVLDQSHLIEFNQFDGIVIDESLTFRKLLGLLKMFAIELAGAEKVKFYVDYYPFTEPSVQLSAKHPKLGWIELGGAGIFREEITKPLNINVPVIAWGLGIDRLAMVKLGIDDIRHLFSYDLEWLRNAKVI